MTWLCEHPLDEDARARLLARYARHRRPEDLERLVRSYRPLATALARRYASGPQGDPDLEQAACEGLVKALQRFEPARGTTFTAYAVPTILGEVRRYLRDTTWPAHVPRSVQERVSAVRKVGVTFSAVHGRAPRVDELCSLLELAVEDVVEALSAESSTRTVSLQAERGREDDLTVEERLGVEDPGYEHVECLAAIERAFPSLPVEEQAVVQLHFGRDLTQRQIAAQLGFSRSQVGRLLGSALAHLRATAA